jgi:hypothetical protein
MHEIRSLQKDSDLIYRITPRDNESNNVVQTWGTTVRQARRFSFHHFIQTDSKAFSILIFICSFFHGAKLLKLEALWSLTSTSSICVHGVGHRECFTICLTSYSIFVMCKIARRICWVNQPIT